MNGQLFNQGLHQLEFTVAQQNQPGYIYRKNVNVALPVEQEYKAH